LKAQENGGGSMVVAVSVSSKSELLPPFTCALDLVISVAGLPVCAVVQSRRLCCRTAHQARVNGGSGSLNSYSRRKQMPRHVHAHLAAGPPVSTAAGPPDCCVASPVWLATGLPVCTVAGPLVCAVAGLPVCAVAGPPVYVVAGPPVCVVAGLLPACLHCCRTARLCSCRIAR
jgi:hypothetical protein